jgi:hypothetical protein
MKENVKHKRSSVNKCAKMNTSLFVREIKLTRTFVWLFVRDALLMI